MTFQDKQIACVDCGVEFVHSAADQQRYAERGFAHEPKRCKTCRDKRKAEGGAKPQRGPAVGTRPQRQLFPAVCAACGKQTEVPFKPTTGRPVYCRDCHQAQKGSAGNTAYPRHGTRP